jgi:catalase (peroxidase I)
VHADDEAIGVRRVNKLTPGSNLLWESSRMILPEHKERILSHRDEVRRGGRRERPVMDEQEWERINEAIKVLDTIRQLQQEVAALRKEVSIQSAQVGALLAAHDIDEAPQWAKEAVDAAVAAGIVDTPQGSSLDFYRFVTILHRLGLISRG